MSVPNTSDLLMRYRRACTCTYCPSSRRYDLESWTESKKRKKKRKDETSHSLITGAPIGGESVGSFLLRVSGLDLQRCTYPVRNIHIHHYQLQTYITRSVPAAESIVYNDSS